MRTRQMDDVSNLGHDQKPASDSWKSLSAEEADDPTLSAVSVKEDVPRDARKAAEKAEHLAKKNRHEEAIAGFQEALKIDPRYYEAGNNLALEFEAIGKAADAETILRGLTHSAPAHILALGIWRRFSPSSVGMRRRKRLVARPWYCIDTHFEPAISWARLW